MSTLLTSDLEVDVQSQVIHHREAVQRLADVPKPTMSKNDAFIIMMVHMFHLLKAVVSLKVLLHQFRIV